MGGRHEAYYRSAATNGWAGEATIIEQSRDDLRHTPDGGRDAGTTFCAARILVRHRDCAGSPRWLLFPQSSLLLVTRTMHPKQARQCGVTKLADAEVVDFSNMVDIYVAKYVAYECMSTDIYRQDPQRLPFLASACSWVVSSISERNFSASRAAMQPEPGNC